MAEVQVEEAHCRNNLDLVDGLVAELQMRNRGSLALIGWSLTVVSARGEDSPPQVAAWQVGFKP
jgi:hypothetical protein